MRGTRVCWPEPGRAVLESFEVPEPGPGEILVETEMTLISPGTERAFLLGLPNAQGKFPQYPGYSQIGRVAAAGPGVDSPSVGERVGSGAGHASHVVTRAERVWSVPKGLDPAEAVFFRLATIALQGVRKTRVELGEATLVLGLGLIGNLGLQLARLQGALPAIGLDPDAGRREVAQRCGADLTLDPTAENAGRVLAAATAGRGPAVVVEATGSPEAVNEAFAWAGVQARVVLLASTRGTSETNFYRDVHKKGLTVIGAHASVLPARDSSPGFWTLTDDVGTALRLLAAGRLQVKLLTSEIVPYEEAPRAYEALASWRKDLLGMVLGWR